MRAFFYRITLVSLVLLTGVTAQAATWTLDPSESHVVFNYSYEGAPTKGG
jgi:polyisoprenoid-binding protein YceI